MSFSVTNQRSAQANRGQSVIVTLNASDSAQLANMSIGQKCTASISSNIGYIDFIDAPGHQFRVKPEMPNHSFLSIENLAYLMAGSTITVEE